MQRKQNQQSSQYLFMSSDEAQTLQSRASYCSTDSGMYLQDYLMKSAMEGQTIAGFVEDIIFQQFCIDPESPDSRERWVCNSEPSCQRVHLKTEYQLQLKPGPSYLYIVSAMDDSKAPMNTLLPTDPDNDLPLAFYVPG